MEKPTIPHISETLDEELTTNYIKSREIEKDILKCLYQVLDFSIVPHDTKDSNDGLNHSLEKMLCGTFKDWQLFSSGTSGTVFARLLGTGILDDPPEECDSQKTPLGVIMTRTPQSRNDNCKVDVYIDASESAQGAKTYKLSFSTSLTNIDSRLDTLTKEIDKARKRPQID